MNPSPINTHEIVKRLQIGFALLVGYATGKYFAAFTTDNPSEFFVLGFVFGYVLSHTAYWVIKRLSKGKKK